ncbi:peptidylprolyl isomerase [Sphingosinicella rhizophila]|uniref:Parvulin-like PPIase n=1 Tax=Sphingosinicella rhizophila TaxID=3050082 RepID=A0ABU3Q258_9SPHN|nr:peptidyl-prolyl cis-trans isomerase [Sphingosinicella sp. GR2756]MDT9597506.1 peptidyl-prolyl cis-trans isomerase [Sphingosinicella sp. GR2756]
MLSYFRRGVTAKIMLGLLFITLIALVITGFGTGGSGLGGLGGLGSSSVASVEGETITTGDVTEQVNRQLARARQRSPELDIATFVRSGAIEQIVGDMITSTALLVFGRDIGIGASVDMVNREIAGIPAFQNMAGQFDNDVFRRALAQEKISETKLREEIEASLIQRQMLLPVGGSAQAPRGIALQYASLLLETRSGSVGLVPAEAMGAGTEPSAQDITTFYNSSKARYTIPERRVIRYATFGREQVAAGSVPTDAEITAFYQRNAASYGPTETRTLSQVVLPDEAAARAFAAKLAAGTSFARAAADAGFSAADTSVGQQSKDAFAKASTAAVANAAFTVAEGAATAPIKSELGWHVVRVDAINRTPARPLATVRGEIAAQLGQQKMEQALADLEAKIQDSLGEGSSIEEIARANNLTIRETSPITATGAAPGNPDAQTPPEVRPLLQTAFDMVEDEDPVVEPVVPGQLFAIVQIAKIVPAAAPPLAQIRERVKADLVVKRANDRARAVAGSILAKVNAGTPVAKAFAEAQMPLPPVSPIMARRMDLVQRQEGIPPPLAMLFSMPRGKARLIAAPGGQGWYVVQLDKVVPGDASKVPALVETTRTQFAQVLGDEYTRQFTRAVQAEKEVKRNEDAVAALKNQLTGGPAR